MIYKYGDTEIYYERIGKGMPILIIHGYFVDHNIFKPYVEEVLADSEDYERIYIDLPAMGKSTVGKNIESMNDYLGAIIAFIKEIIAGKDFLIMGNSLGGLLAQLLAMFLGDQVKGLFLLVPALVIEEGKRNLPKNAVQFVEDFDIDKATLELFKETNVFINKDSFKVYKRDVLAAMALANIAFLEKSMEASSASAPMPDLGLANFVFKEPATILLGRQDTVTGYQDMIDVMENYPRASLAVIDLAGHNLIIDQPEAFKFYVEDFIRRIDFQRKI